MKRNFVAALNNQIDRFTKSDSSITVPHFVNTPFFRRIMKGQEFPIAENNPLFPVKEYFPAMAQTYALLADQRSRDLYAELIIFRQLFREKKIKLSIDTPERQQKIDFIAGLRDGNETIETDYRNMKLEKFDLSRLNYKVRLFGNAEGIYILFDDKQYEYAEGPVKIAAEKGDVVMDLGGCWGDSSLFFAEKTGDTGRVVVFEFIPKNIEVFLRNTGENSALAERITLIRQPVWNKPGLKMYYLDRGPASLVQFRRTEECKEEITTTTLDEVAEKERLARVDFIKMDIEGAELDALKGALHILKKYRPKLAISIYHNWDQFSGIAPWIDSLGLGYRFYLSHYTTVNWETVLYAVAD